MPINCTAKLKELSDDRFRNIDYSIMGNAFTIHNDFGRLLDESIYQEALRRQCEESGLSAKKEVSIRVTHQSFSKTYYIDLLIEQGSIYELKATSSISPAHESQLLNYLLLSGLQHGKIINFRGQSVESRFVSTSLINKDRHEFKIRTRDWIANSEHCEKIPQIIEALLNDWGTHLDIHLYREALLHLIDRDHSLLTPLELFNGTNPLGQQNEYLLNETTGLHLSSLRTGFSAYKAHLLRFLKHTNLKTIQWINFGAKQITCSSIQS